MLLNIQHLTKIYKQHQAVKDISFYIKKGTCTALLGPNGAGKTTTLQMLAGLLTPTAGSIEFPDYNGRDYRHLIGFLPQHPSFFSWMTPREFLRFAGKLSGMTKQQLTLKIDETLEFVSLSDVKNKKIGGFSGGMKQRLGLAQALLHEPELLILDEPVSALDPNGRRDVLQILEQLKERTTILFSTHVLHDAEQVCESVIMLKDGEIKWDDSLPALKREFSTKALSIQTEQPLQNIFEGIPELTDIEYKEFNHALLYFDESINSNELVKLLLDKNMTLTHFERMQDSLEDAYMRVMNQ